MIKRLVARGFASSLVLCAAAAASAAGNDAAIEAPAVAPAPPRAEGDGPYSQLILRNVVVIRGSGAPAFGPADVVIEGNRFVLRGRSRKSAQTTLAVRVVATSRIPLARTTAMLFVGNEVDWTMNTSSPRTFSCSSTKISMSAKRRTMHLASGNSR